MIKSRIKLEIAYQIFNEVNKKNKTLEYIDLSCLTFEDAIIISKQHLYELAREVHEKKLEYKVMNIRCAEDHLVVMQDESGRAPLKNCIKEMVQYELFLDHHYIPALNTLLVKIGPKDCFNFK